MSHYTRTKKSYNKKMSEIRKILQRNTFSEHLVQVGRLTSAGKKVSYIRGENSDYESRGYRMYNFDTFPNRRNTNCVKWDEAPEGVIPMWVADMDFCTAPPIVEALEKRASHPCFGYPNGDSQWLKELVAKHYEKVYQVKVETEWIVWVPSVIPGVVAALQMAGGTFMYSVPMYNHIRTLYKEAKLPVIEVPLKKDADSRFSMDIPAMEAALTPDVKSVILCNPHNPVGRVYTRAELEELQQFCKKHHLLLISDEIHCELALDQKHIPYFAVNGESSVYSVTLSSAGKICNIPGLPMGFAIIPDRALREAFISQQDGLLPSGNVLTLAAYEKAYDGSCDAWKKELRERLVANRDLVDQWVSGVPGITAPHNEGTYLAWLDCSALGLEDPAEFFEKKAGVMVSPGEIYGDSQCVRLNYGCPEAQLREALERMKKAVL